jgi:hypothetical protein
MSKQPTRAFVSAFTSAMSDVAAQAVRHEVISKRMTAAAIAAVTGLAIGLTAAPAPAQAQHSNVVMRTAANVVGGVIGGAIGNQIGGGSGKKAATVAGVAAGVWTAEALQSEPVRQRDRTVTILSSDSFGPTIAPGWSNTRVPTLQPAADYSRPATAAVTYTHLPARQLQLQSGTTQMSDERMAKLIAMEGMFLAARDGYARAIYASEQATDDAVLDGASRAVQQRLTATRAQQRHAQNDYEAARSSFVNAVEHMGTRGYDVHHFSHSHKIAQARVTAGDMRRGDVVRVTRGARIIENYDDLHAERGDSFSNR